MLLRYNHVILYSAYALAYFAKVRKQLEQENPNAFKDFVNTLGHFQSNSNSIMELYKKMESILGGYPDLMDEKNYKPVTF